MDKKLSIIVLISGNGSNLQAIIDAQHTDAQQTGPDIYISAVISNKADAFGLERAKHANIPTHVIPHQGYSSREAFDHALMELIDQHQPQLIVLAGFMRRLSDEFVQQYRGKLINIHPSLLPKYPGLHTHQRVLEHHDTPHGCSIHFVTEDLDAGPVIAQASLTVHKEDNEHTLQHRVQQLEHVLYPHVLRQFAEGRLQLINNHAHLNGKRLPVSGYLYTQ